MKFLSVAILFIMAVSLSVHGISKENTKAVSRDIQASVDKEDGILCKARDKDGDVVASCLICNCKKLQEAVDEQLRKNEELEKELAEE